MQKPRRVDEPHALKEELIELLKEFRNAIKCNGGRRI